MEVMEVTLATVQEISYIITHHPVYSAIGSFIVFLCMLRFYCKLTMGICDVEQDMTGKTVLITGGSAGIGKATAMEMAKRNARVLLACRNMGKANKVALEIRSATGNQNVVVKCLDLTSFESVRECAKSVLESEERLDVLINNAGISESEGRKQSVDGYEMVMQSNHLGHFLLTLLLLNLIKKSAPSRIINLSSVAHKWANLDLTNFKTEIKRFHTYANSKLANILFTRELADRLQGTGVTVNSLHPGAVKTAIIHRSRVTPMTLITKFIFLLVGKTPEEGAQTSIQLAVDPALEKTSGKYFADCKLAPVTKTAEDKVLARQLFAASERIVGETFSRT